MIEMLRPFLVRTVAVIAPRAVAVMVGGGLLTGFGSQVIDLRGELPVSTTRHYTHRPIGNVEGVVWHHSATKGASIHSIAEYHVEVRQWPGVAYHYAIGWDGIVYVLNDPTTISYQAQGYNSRTIGVVLIGNYEERRPTPEMEASIARLNGYLREKYHLRFAWLHGETKSTLCPGKYAAAYLRPLLYWPRPPR
jgi:hypothetical protein